jgi:hypothetical protein
VTLCQLESIFEVSQRRREQSGYASDPEGPSVGWWAAEKPSKLLLAGFYKLTFHAMLSAFSVDRFWFGPAMPFDGNGFPSRFAGPAYILFS